MKPPEFSLNWIIGSREIERIYSATGKVCDAPNTPSRISKHALFGRFLYLRKQLKHLTADSTLPTPARPLYETEKLLATDYQSAKEACIDAFASSGLGNWRYAMKPAEIDRFDYE